ncbi:hypothetical protein ACHHYP_05613 [Achlya hypogyna]|uniref:Uncharacterized protein n=1 Tax=Achlya hypogyna TaxID=1202772 RepID=A0A1V9YX93_ACHHY|nr:hypothetical protein ACHHYP_05613 [Achlya hypogyna]
MAYPVDSAGAKWNGDAFASSLGADLLTFSVAPLTHVMKSVGATLQRHDSLLDELSEALKKLHHAQHETEQGLILVKANDPSRIRDEVLEMIEGIEKRVEGSEADIAQANALGHSLGGKVAIIEEHEAKLDDVEATVVDLGRTVSLLQGRMSDFLLPEALDGLKQQILAEVQEQIFGEVRAQLRALPPTSDQPPTDQLADETDVEDAADEGDDADDAVATSTPPSAVASPTQDLPAANETPEVLPPSKVADAVMSTPDKRHLPRRSTSSHPVKHTRGPGTDELEAQVRELEARVDRAERDRTGVLERMERLQQSVASELRDVRPRAPSFSAPVPIEVKTPALLTNAAYEAALESQASKLSDMAKQLQALQDHLAAASDGLETNKGAIKTTQDDLRKLRHQVDEFQETQQLMQSFAMPAATSSNDEDGATASKGAATPDLSMVFSKLADMRQAQVAASEELRDALDAVAVKTADQGRELHKWSESLQRARETSREHVEGEAGKLKEALAKQLHQQNELITAINEWLHLGHDIHHDLHHPDGRNPTSRIADLQNLGRQYHFAAPTVAHLITAPGVHQATLLRLRHQLHDTPDGAEKVAATDLLHELAQDLASLDKTNDALMRGYDQARVMIDELWFDWYHKQHGDARQKHDALAKDVADLRQLQQVLARPAASSATKEPERKANVSVGVLESATPLSSHHNEALKKMEQLLMTAQRRMDGFEDDLRVLSRNVLAYRNDLADKVTDGQLSKLKFQIFSELAKIHSFMGSSKFTAPPKMVEHTTVYDDAEIKCSLDAQAEMIAKLCADLKKEKDDREKEAAGAGVDVDLSKFTAETDRFNTRLESITEKVAEMFVSLEVNRSATQPRHSVPIFNPAQMLDNFAQTIDAKLAETQDLTKKDIERIKAELGENVRARVRRAMESLKETLPSVLDGATTAVGTVMCIACSRPVKFDVSTSDVTREVPSDMLGIPLDEEEPGVDREDPEFVYRAGFRMPVNEKHCESRRHRKNVLPLLVSPRLPAKGRLEKPKGRRLVKSKDNRVDSLFREVDELDQSAMNVSDKPLKSVDKKAIEARRPVAPARP